MTFSDLTPHEEKQLYTVDKYFVNEDKEEAPAAQYSTAGKAFVYD